MKSLEDFKVYYENSLRPSLETLENQRVLRMKKFSVILVPIWIVAFGLAYLFRHQGPASFYVIFVSVIISVSLHKLLGRSFKLDFKVAVIQKMIEFIDPSLKYNESQHISMQQFTSSKLFLTPPDILGGDDHVHGTLGETVFEFSEVSAKEKVESNDSQTKYHTIFKGLFFIADFNKHFSGETYVLPDASERLLGSIGTFLQSLGPRRPEVVTLEDPEFERLFVTYSTDQTEARYILSPSLILRILEFRKKVGRSVRLSFINSNLHIAVPFTKNLFEPNMMKSLLNFKPFQEYFEDLHLAIGIVEELNLNTRIWSKS